MFSDLFYYNSYDEFKKVHREILDAPNFKTIDEDAGNGAYSAGMLFYSKFLKEYNEKSSFILQDDLIKKDEKRYWIYAPGEGAKFWDEFYEKDIMAIGWDYLGNISKYKEKSEVKDSINKIKNDNKNHKNDTLAVWNFYNDINIGDIIYTKCGVSNIIGRGVVVGEYEYQEDRTEFKHIRKVDWTHKQNVECPDRLKSYISTIANITLFLDVIKKLEESFGIKEKPSIKLYLEPYKKEDFLKDVYMNENEYKSLVSLLKRKKNVVLQGAPGVGKTFTAQRLAFSIMGEKDTSRVKIVQFHQSYSYEDFIMGYRPNDTGFTLLKGSFYEFCKEAEKDYREHFFIIDEINRGNLSKIFGELLMLIENDKRGENHSIRLIYMDEQFSVPFNLHIIGMMNTADRSLAMIDYALRRRFAFFEIPPAFSSNGFKTYQTNIKNNKFDLLVNVVEALNNAISGDASLGNGFRIGHSYFCTSEIVDDSWLFEVVEYELIPLLNEYWFDEISKLEEWSSKLRGAIRG